MKYEISKYNPCREAIQFRAKYDSFEEAWNACERGDWMLWLAHQIKVDLRVLTLAKGRCAELVIDLLEDERSIKAIKIAIAFGEGKATRKELDDAADAANAAADAYAYAYAATSYVATVAATVAASAASAARAAAYADADAANAARAAAYAAASAATSYVAAVAAEKEIFKKSAQICREVFGDKVTKLLTAEGGPEALEMLNQIKTP